MLARGTPVRPVMSAADPLYLWTASCARLTCRQDGSEHLAASLLGHAQR